MPGPAPKEIIEALNLACGKLGIDYFLIGARARDYWFEKFELSTRRFTRDVDFAVLVNSIDDFNKLLVLLEKEFSFKILEKIPHRVIWIKDDIIVDLIPFGNLAKAGYIHFEDKFDTVISVTGLKEAFEHSVLLKFNEKNLKLATLPGISILKLISWSAKPEDRSKDIVDIFNIIEHYFEIESENIYKYHLDIFDSKAFTTQKSGARVLGREIARLCETSGELKQRLIEILSENIGNVDNPGKIIQILTYQTDVDQADLFDLFNELLRGSEEFRFDP